MVAPSDVEVIESPVPVIGEGEALVRTDLVAIDAAVRTWLNDQPGYLPPVEIGENWKGYVNPVSEGAHAFTYRGAPQSVSAHRAAPLAR